MEFATLDEVVAYDSDLGQQIDMLKRRLADKSSVPRLSSQARMTLNRQLEGLRRRRRQLREDYALQGLRTR